jgi:hypothetical protein
LIGFERAIGTYFDIELKEQMFDGVVQDRKTADWILLSCPNSTQHGLDLETTGTLACILNIA